MKTCTATTKTGKLCKRPGYRWPNGKVLCAPHAFADLATAKR